MTCITEVITEDKSLLERVFERILSLIDQAT